MKQPQDNAAPFAFRLAEAQDKPQQAEWQVRSDVAVAGCTGLDARANKYPNRDNGIYC
ncbi:MAG: hypothetical protein ACTHOH_14865 [Lysobacteraceae bacterium]